MKTLIVQRQGSVVRSLAGQFRVEVNGDLVAAYPADLVEEILVLGGVSLTTPALRDVLARRGSVHLLTLGGQHLGMVTPGLRGYADLVRQQVRATDDAERTLALAKNVITGKFRNSRATLQRWSRGNPTFGFERAITAQEEALRLLPLVRSSAELLGLEGQAAAEYFVALRDALPPVWMSGSYPFTTRQRRPPPDPINALLSLGYSLLLAHVLTDIQRTGLHPAIGVYHVSHGTRPALALDLMEEHRPALVDRFVVQLLTRRVITPAMFEVSAGFSGPAGIRLNAEGRALFLRAFSERLATPVRSKGNLEHASYRDLITRQVRAFATAIREDKPYQPAFFR